MRIPMFQYKIAAVTGEVSQPHRKPVLSNSFGCLLASEREGGGGATPKFQILFLAKKECQCICDLACTGINVITYTYCCCSVKVHC